MLNGINIEEVKKYNDSIKYYKDQSARLSVEIEMNEKELKQLCEQLTAELGVEVTPDNIEQVYNEQVQKINQTLTTGNAVLEKIKTESQQVKAAPVNVQAQTPVQTPVQPSMQSAGMPTPPPAPTMQGGTLFGGSPLPAGTKLPDMPQFF